MLHAALKAKCAPIKYLVFSGGGTKVTAALGFLIECREREVPWSFATQTEGIAGTSAGAFLAALLIMTKFDMHRTLEAITALQHIHILDVNKLVNLFSPQLALVGMDTTLPLILDPWLDRYCQHQKHVTLLQFYQQFHVWLRISTVDFLTQQPVVLDHLSDPDLPLREAIWASMALPWIAQPLVQHGRFLVDGGLLCNFDMHAFGLMNEPYTFGINIDSGYTYILDTLRGLLVQGTAPLATPSITQSTLGHMCTHASLFMSVLLTPLHHLQHLAHQLYNPQQYVTITGFTTFSLSFDVLKKPEGLLQIGRHRCTQWLQQQTVYYVIAVWLEHYIVAMM
jgi:predicted acylesterase/phospholipase RssA